MRSLLPPDDLSKPYDVKLLKLYFQTVAVITAALSAWNHRFELYPDGVSYLDLADRFIESGFQGLVHLYWSPLYPFILALAKSILSPSPYWEFGLVQLVNFIIFIFLLLSFDLFLTLLIQFNKSKSNNNKNSFFVVPDWAFVIVGYSIFIWASIELTTIWKATPDMLVGICVYLASSIILKIRLGNYKLYDFMLLGLIFGLGYLAKAVMIPFVVMYLVFLIASIKDLKKSAYAALISFLVFGLIAAPQVIAMSRAKGGFTINESGKLNYAWFVNGIPLFAHWQGKCPTWNKKYKKVVNGKVKYSCEELGKPVHPVRRIYYNPPVYEFEKPIIATYAPWFDPVYWYEGVKPKFDLGGHLWAFNKWKKHDKNNLFLGVTGGLFILVGMLLFFYVSNKFELFFISLFKHWDLLVLAIFVLLVAFFSVYNDRYVGQFIVLFWLAVLSGFNISSTKESIRLVKGLSFLVTVTMLMTVSSVCKETISQIKTKPVHQHWEVASYLERIGIKPGDKVAHFGNSWYALWARLARVRIIAEIGYKKGKLGPFWAQSKSIKDEIIKTIASKTEAKVIVTQKAPYNAAKEGWRKVNNSPHYVYDLRK